MTPGEEARASWGTQGDGCHLTAFALKESVARNKDFCLRQTFPSHCGIDTADVSMIIIKANKKTALSPQASLWLG